MIPTDSTASPTIVVVDDEQMVLDSLRTFLDLETEYHVVGFTSAREALEFVEGQPVDLVVSDFLMPEMDGISFLKAVRDVNPTITRIILTGYADKENAIRGINTVGLFRYIEKPWDNDDLLITLRNGLEKHMLLKRINESLDQINRTYDELMGLQKAIVKTLV